ncbi:potassium-transporting ATPase subunit KdpA [Actinacidiphila oryziradicis]|uniref:Potassium-transporting ATPase subunit KdpA n=1 Tax=Actinacidiphila oryziradicis TaxID=2571141 RepID=A0A4U0RFQ5_9ACTN|nr:potassium-transporting ATPase subunit KdpA [Actinacidiphila oryziradicis]
MPGSTLFGMSADGAANASYDSFSSLGGGVLMAATMLGEIAPAAPAAPAADCTVLTLLNFFPALSLGPLAEGMR